MDFKLRNLKLERNLINKIVLAVLGILLLLLMIFNLKEVAYGQAIMLSNQPNMSLNQSGLYCFFDQNLNFNCQSEGGLNRLKMEIKEIDQRRFFISPENLNLSAEKYQFLLLRLKSRVDYPHFRLYVILKGKGAFLINDLERIYNSILASQNFKTYYFRMSDSIFWQGVVDKFYLETEKDIIEFESVKLVGSSSGVFLKTIWQEFLTLQPERFFWINTLLEIMINNISVMKYIFIFVLITIVVLILFKIRDKDLKKNWQKIILIIFLFFWLILEMRMIYENIYWLKRDFSLLYLAPNQKREVLVSQMAGNSKFGPDIYAYLNFVKNKIPVGAKVFLFGNSDYPYILLTYHLVENYQLVRQPNQADYLLIYDRPLVELPEFSVYDSLGPNRLIYKRK